MKTFSVCILDADQIRADIIKDALKEYGYSPKVFNTEASALKSVVEDIYDVAFVSSEFTNNISEFLDRFKKLSEHTHIIGMLQDSSSDSQIAMSEMDVKHYVYI